MDDADLEVEAYDDADCYAGLLQDYIAARGARAAAGGASLDGGIADGIDTGTSVALAAAIAARQKKRKRARDVDTKASKGRKLKYVEPS